MHIQNISIALHLHLLFNTISLFKLAFNSLPHFYPLTTNIAADLTLRLSSERAHFLLGWWLVTTKSTAVLLSLRTVATQTDNKAKDATHLSQRSGWAGGKLKVALLHICFFGKPWYKYSGNRIYLRLSVTQKTVPSSGTAMPVVSVLSLLSVTICLSVVWHMQGIQTEFL